MVCRPARQRGKGEAEHRPVRRLLHRLIIWVLWRHQRLHAVVEFAAEAAHLRRAILRRGRRASRRGPFWASFNERHPISTLVESSPTLDCTAPATAPGSRPWTTTRRAHGMDSSQTSRCIRHEPWRRLVRFHLMRPNPRSLSPPSSPSSASTSSGRSSRGRRP